MNRVHPGFVFVEVKDGKARYRKYGHLSENSSIKHGRPADTVTLTELAETMARMLVEQGLYEKEALNVYVIIPEESHEIVTRGNSAFVKGRDILFIDDAHFLLGTCRIFEKPTDEAEAALIETQHGYVRISANIEVTELWALYLAGWIPSRHADDLRQR